IVTGLYGKPISVVFAAGNLRSMQPIDDCSAGPYGTIGPPATAKNVITVGAINSDDQSMTIFSSWGPVRDGRLKPELVAPGAEVGNDGGVTSTMPGNSYGVLVGTSMATPVVSGAVALLVEDYRAHYNGQDPAPSTLKGLLVHTASDLDDDTSWFNKGPDFASGYGLVQIQDAVDQLRNQGFLVGQVGHHVPVPAPGQEPLLFTPATIPVPPGIMMEKPVFSDHTEAAKNNGFIDPCETITEMIVLRNAFGPAASNVTATIHTDTTGIE